VRDRLGRGIARRAALLAVLLLPGVATSAAGADTDRHGRLYRAGRQAHLAGNQRSAVLLLLDAIHERANEGEPWVRLYGRHRAPYLPYFYLGAALFELGEYERARVAFDESDRQGAVRHAEEAARLQDYRRRLEHEAAPALRERATAEADLLRALLLRLDRTLELAGGNPESDGVRADASDALASVERLVQRSAPIGSGSIPSWREAASRLDEAAARVSRAILDTEAERAAREAELRSRALRELVEPAIESCDRSRLERIGSALDEGAFEPDPVAEARLARARIALACADPGSARRELDRTREAIAEIQSAPRADRLRLEADRVEDDAARLDLERRWSAIGIHAAAGSCDVAVAEELERFALEPEERTRRFSPHLALSRARLACGDVARAAASLEMARRLGEGDEAQRRELADRIATAAAAAERAARQASELREEALRRAHEEARRELLAGYVNLAAAAALGECDTAALARLDRLLSDPGERATVAWLRRTAGLREEPEDVMLAALASCGDVDGVRRRLESAMERDEALESSGAREAKRWLIERQVGSIYLGRRALLIGASDYAAARSGWWNLEGVRSDIAQLAEFLRSAGFDTVEVVSRPVTGARVREAVASFVDRFADGDDLLLFYFAGHGDTLTATLDSATEGYEFKSGYFVPEDAPRPGDDPALREAFLERAIGMDEVERWAQAIRAKHALFLFDTCFSGTVFRAVSRGRGLVLVRDEERSTTRLPALVQARAASPVRLFATAGTEDQVVPDESIFRRLLLEALSGRRRDADYTRDGFLLGRELCLFLEDQVAHETASRQTPQCGTMPPPFNEGDVVFRIPAVGAGHGDPRAVARERLRLDVESWRHLHGTPGGLATYLEHHPAGTFAGLARYLTLQDATAGVDQPGS